MGWYLQRPNETIGNTSKKAIRTVYKNKPNTHTQPLFAKGEIMPLDGLITYHSALLAKPIRINTSNLLTEIPLPPGPTTRLQLEPEQLVIPRFKLFKLSKQCSSKIPEIWNKLPY